MIATSPDFLLRPSLLSLADRANTLPPRHLTLLPGLTAGQHILDFTADAFGHDDIWKSFIQDAPSPSDAPEPSDLGSQHPDTSLGSPRPRLEAIERDGATFYDAREPSDTSEPGDPGSRHLDLTPRLRLEFIELRVRDTLHRYRWVADEREWRYEGPTLPSEGESRTLFQDAVFFVPYVRAYGEVAMIELQPDNDWKDLFEEGIKKFCRAQDTGDATKAAKSGVYDP
ncbi:hypothetical protein GGR56DRAFT_672590 [Xylariaceae sp. FL0804]|nr:hypothetical protein GGR56DRAFT_672590 [Xylariaceae sp. FL0804]